MHGIESSHVAMSAIGIRSTVPHEQLDLKQRLELRSEVGERPEPGSTTDYRGRRRPIRRPSAAEFTAIPKGCLNDLGLVGEPHRPNEALHGASTPQTGPLRGVQGRVRSPGAFDRGPHPGRLFARHPLDGGGGGGTDRGARHRLKNNHHPSGFTGAPHGPQPKNAPNSSASTTATSRARSEVANLGSYTCQRRSRRIQ